FFLDATVTTKRGVMPVCADVDAKHMTDLLGYLEDIAMYEDEKFNEETAFKLNGERGVRRWKAAQLIKKLKVLVNGCWKLETVFWNARQYGIFPGSLATDLDQTTAPMPTERLVPTA